MIRSWKEQNWKLYWREDWIPSQPPTLEEELKRSLDGITELVFDFGKLEYISSAGLRVLLAAQKIMNKQGSMIIKNVNDVINDVFEVTGFSDILTIE